ncbi:hypothetical protein Tco_0502450 [Tanacetum coccineum]
MTEVKSWPHNCLESPNIEICRRMTHGQLPMQMRVFLYLTSTGRYRLFITESYAASSGQLDGNQIFENAIVLCSYMRGAYSPRRQHNLFTLPVAQLWRQLDELTHKLQHSWKVVKRRRNKQRDRAHNAPPTSCRYDSLSVGVGPATCSSCSNVNAE